MSDDANDAAAQGPMAIDEWLGAAGFADAELDPSGWVEVDESNADKRDDPWADIIIEPPTLTAAQRRFLLGSTDFTDSGAVDLAAADAEIIEIPDDPDHIDPFEP
jgi:hypothetical protein